jgi:hypothetical protein
MITRNTNVPFKGRIQKRKTHRLQIIHFRLQRAAGPYRWAIKRHSVTCSIIVGAGDADGRPDLRIQVCSSASRRAAD